MLKKSRKVRDQGMEGRTDQIGIRKYGQMKRPKREERMEERLDGHRRGIQGCKEEWTEEINEGKGRWKEDEGQMDGRKGMNSITEGQEENGDSAVGAREGDLWVAPLSPWPLWWP